MFLKWIHSFSSCAFNNNVEYYTVFYPLTNLASYAPPHKQMLLIHPAPRTQAAHTSSLDPQIFLMEMI